MKQKSPTVYQLGFFGSTLYAVGIEQIEAAFDVALFNRSTLYAVGIEPVFR